MTVDFVGYFWWIGGSFCRRGGGLEKTSPVVVL